VDLASGDPAQTTTLASNIAYVPFGPMTGLTYGNELTFSQTVDRHLPHHLIAGTRRARLDKRLRRLRQPHGEKRMGSGLE